MIEIDEGFQLMSIIVGVCASFLGVWSYFSLKNKAIKEMTTSYCGGNEALRESFEQSRKYGICAFALVFISYMMQGLALFMPQIILDKWYFYLWPLVGMCILGIIIFVITLLKLLDIFYDKQDES